MYQCTKIHRTVQHWVSFQTAYSLGLSWLTRPGVWRGMAFGQAADGQVAERFICQLPTSKKLEHGTPYQKPRHRWTYQPCLRRAGLSGIAKNSGLLPELQEQGGRLLDWKMFRASIISVEQKEKNMKNETTRLRSSSNLSMKHMKLELRVTATSPVLCSINTEKI